MGTSRVEVLLLGRFEVRRDGRPVPTSAYGGRQAQRLVRMLAAARGAHVSRDGLIDALWGDDLPADPAANLHVVVTRARHALGGDAVETRPGGYALSAEVATDAHRFEDAARTAAAHRGPPDERLAAHREALALWTGEPLPEDRYDDWARSVRERLLHRRQDLLESGAEAALEVGDTTTATQWAREAAAEHPLREPACLLLVRALAAAGDTAGALREYDALRRRLADELGIDPSPEARGLHERLLRQDPPVRPGLRSDPVPLVGRAEALAVAARVREPGTVTVVRAPAGGGKTRLLAEARTVAGGPVLPARAVLPERALPWSLARRVLRSAAALGADPGRLSSRLRAALADVLPEQVDEEGVALDAESRRALALDAAQRLLATAPSRRVLVDDLQWADASSLDLLAALAADPACSLLVACRSGEHLTPAVAAFLDRLRGQPSHAEVRLRPLGVREVGELLPDPELAHLVAELTDGTPFEVLEVLDGLSRAGVVRRQGPGWVRVDRSDAAAGATRATALEGRRRTIAARLSRQTEDAQRLAAVVALLGRPAGTDLLARASGVDDPAPRLAELVDADLVRLDSGGWATAHDLVGETIRDQLGDAERTALHRAVAAALDRTPELAAERAHHLAGGGERSEAAASYAVAARVRLDACADAEALALSEAGLALDPHGQECLELLRTRAELRSRAGDRAGARADLRRALSVATRPEDRSRLLAALALHAGGGEDMALAGQLAELALVEAGGSPSVRANALRIAAIVDMNLERPERAEERYDEALRLFREVGDAAGVIDVMDARTMAAFMRGEVATATAELARVAELFEDLGRLFRVVQPLSTSGHGLVFQDRPAEGLTLTERALELARSLGDREGTTYALWHRAEALAALGDGAAALASGEEALAIATELGHRGWTATACRAVGIARLALGDLDAAEVAFRRSLETSRDLPLFGSWARSRLAMVANLRGDHATARRLAEEALGIGPPLGHHEARLALAEAALGLGAPDAGALVEAALAGEQAGFRLGLGGLRAPA